MWRSIPAMLGLLVLLSGAIAGPALAQPATPAPDVLERLQASPAATPGATPVSLDGLKDLPLDAGGLPTLPDRDDDGFRVGTGVIEIAILATVVLAVIAGTVYTWRYPRDG